MIPDTDEQLIAEARRHGMGFNGGRILATTKPQLRALINHYIALDRAQGQEPEAYIRRWAFDGEIPQKTVNKNGKSAWPAKYKLLPITKKKILEDDLPLYTHAQPTSEIQQDKRAEKQAIRETLDKVTTGI